MKAVERENPGHGSDLLLVANKLSKRFGGLQALSDVSFAIRKGDIYGLIGPNGAGKTTLFNVMTGLYVPESGTCNFMGREFTRLKPHQIAQAGMARTFQNIRLFGALSALENVMIGRHVRTRAGLFGAVVRNRRTLDEEAAIEARARELLDYVGIGERANHMARALPYGDQRRLEIARALATEPMLLALDEPAAGMTNDETRELSSLVRVLARHMTVIVVEHDMEFVRTLGGHVTVLHQGEVFAEGDIDTLRADDRVLDIYLGRGKHV